MAGKAHDGTELTDELLDSMAKEYEDGTWPGHVGEVHAGRPRFGAERLVPVTIKIAPSVLAAIDQFAANGDETRSEAMRQIIDRGLAKA
ncbi:MAG: ribbon-helix-helix protein, CopG family [Acidobacteriota bacterium]|nr:ribbon-helix-helix protein, CopG family [Acidobacteriota bacterium]